MEGHSTGQEAANKNLACTGFKKYSAVMPSNYRYQMPMPHAKSGIEQEKQFHTPKLFTMFHRCNAIRLGDVRGQCTPLTIPFAVPFAELLDLTCRLARTASASCSRTSTVLSQSTQASVILTPFCRDAKPPPFAAGAFWLPSLILLSIMTPTIPSSPLRSWSPTT